MRKLFLSTLILLTLLSHLLSATVYAASFDCKKAKTGVEKMICADLKLSKLDEELATAYRDATGKPEQTDKAILRKGQNVWLKSRNACKDTLCVEVMYRTRLAMLTSAATAQPQGEAGAFHVSSANGKFWLTYGQGVKVCEAYLERLNRSAYEYHPKCDRPENAEIPGFTSLNRVKLSADELQRFWAPVYSFLQTGRPSWPRTEETDRRVISEMEYFPVFRYESSIDIDNDGVADPLVIWRSGSCNRFSPNYVMVYWDSIPVALNASGDAPDFKRTQALFGHPSGAYRSSGWPRSEFRPIGKSMGIFQFKGRYYMDTFFDTWGDFHDRRRDAPELSRSNPSRQSDDPEIQNRLGVFLREAGETKQVCEYWFEDFSESGHGEIQK